MSLLREQTESGAIGILAALPGELKPLVQGWQRNEHGIWHCSLAAEGWGPKTATSRSVFAFAAGMGREAATRGVRALLDEAARRGEPLSTLVSVGWAGALKAEVCPPQAYAVSQVVDARTGERFTTGQASGLRLVTLDHVAGISEKQRLSESYSASLVDMEAATVGRLARLEGLRFLCYKAVSDGATDHLPDFSRFMSQQGQLRMPAFLAHVALRPGYWGNLARMGANSKRAALELARLLMTHLPLDLKQKGDF